VSSEPHQVPPPPGGSPPPAGGTQIQTGGYAASGPQTNSLAVVSFVASIASFFAHVIPVFGGTVVAVVAIVTGFIARGQIRRTGEQGMWMANAGIIIGFVHLAGLFILLLIFLFLIFVLGIALFGIAAHNGGSLPSPVPSG
jgi:uncharacterized protein DUF4190